MAALIFILIAFSVFFLAFVVIAGLVPLFVSRYNLLRQARDTRIANKLEESFIFWEKEKFLLLSFIPFILGIISFVLFKHIAGLILGFILGLGFPNFMATIATKARIRRFQGQLVDSLMILTSSLKAGLSFIQAIEVLCEEMPAPISQEFYLVLKENKLGVSLEESLRSLRKRIPLEEVNLVVTSILISRESGGELTKVFSRLTETIRNNIKLKEKISTLTLQGKLQGIIMMIMPFAFGYFVYKQNPDHFTVMLQDQQGRMLLFIAAGLQLVGMVLIKKFSTLKI